MTACPGGLSSLNRRPNHPLIPTAPPVTNYGPHSRGFIGQARTLVASFPLLVFLLLTRLLTRLVTPALRQHHLLAFTRLVCHQHRFCCAFFFFLSQNLVKAKGTARLISILKISSHTFEQISCLKPSRLMPLLLARI